MKTKSNLIPNTVIFIIILAVFFTIFNVTRRTHDNRLMNREVMEYYSYLSAVIINKNFTPDFAVKDPTRINNKFFPLQGHDNSNVLKKTMGLSMLNAPFFYVAHNYTLFTKDFLADGFTHPYQFALILGGVFYFYLGLIFLRNTLLRFFTPVVTTLAIFIIVTGTNLFLLLLL